VWINRCQAKWNLGFQYISVDIGGEDGGDIEYFIHRQQVGLWKV